MKQVRLWIVLRIQDYRVTALADLLNPCWEEVSGDTIISEDREAMFQLARRYSGLLCSAEGLPSPRQAERFSRAMATLKSALEGADEPERHEPESSPARSGAEGNELGLPGESTSQTAKAGRSAGKLD